MDDRFINKYNQCTLNQLFSIRKTKSPLVYVLIFLLIFHFLVSIINCNISTHNIDELFDQKKINKRFKFLKFSSASISPRTGNSSTIYSLSILFNTNNFPIKIKGYIEYFDPINGRSVYLRQNFFSYEVPKMSAQYVFNFQHPKIPENILMKIQSDCLKVNYSIFLTDSNGVEEEFEQNDDDYYFDKKKNDHIIPFYINSNPARDNSEKIKEFSNKNFIEKKSILNNTLLNLVNEKDLDENLQISILLSQYLLSTKCDNETLILEFNSNRRGFFENIMNNNIDYTKEGHENKVLKALIADIILDDCHKTLRNTLKELLTNINKNLDCQIFETTILNKKLPNNTIILAALSALYPSYANSAFGEESFKDHVKFLRCLSENWINMLEKINLTFQGSIQNLSNDYMNSIFFTSSNLLNILSSNSIFSNKTFNEKFSIIINEGTFNARNLILNQGYYFSIDKFTDKNFVKSDNLIFFKDKFKKSNIFKIKNNMLYDPIAKKNKTNVIISNFSNYKNFSLKYEDNDTDIIFSLPIEYILEKYNSNEINLNAIAFKKYPLLKNSENKFSNDVVSIKLIDSETQQIISIDDLEDNFPIKIFVKKTDKINLNLNTCLFFDEELENWNDFKCKSNSDKDSDYITCECYHLTEFSFSIFNPVYVYKDLIGIIRDMRFINNLEVFKFCNFSNAGVIYIFLLIFISFMTILLCLYKKQSQKGKFYDKINDETEHFPYNEYLYFYYEDDEITIIKKLCNKNATLRNMKISQTYYNKLTSESYVYYHLGLENDCQKKFEENQDLENRLIEKSDNNYEHSKPVNDSNHTPNSCTNILKPCLLDKGKLSLCSKIFFSFKVISAEYKIMGLIMGFPFIMNRFNLGFILFYDMINYFFVSSLISPNNSISGDPKKTSYGYIYVNRKLAIYILIIIFSKIPSIILSVLLKKKRMPRDVDKIVKEQYKKNLSKIYLFIYIFIFIFFLFAFLNTFWISMINVKSKRANDFIMNFLVSYLMKYIMIFCFILIKSIIFLWIIKRNLKLEDSKEKDFVLIIYNILP